MKARHLTSVLLFAAGAWSPAGYGVEPVLVPADGSESAAPAADVVSKTVSAARVVTCAIVFPLDQVRFSEEQVTDCMKSVNADNVSYIHVIATSSSTGSSSHNLYLSNRRAGAIEAYLVNRFPGIPVHAFGGGVNPKFGKMARIFIVENQGRPEDITAGVQVASIGKPEIIERTTTKYVTRTEYKDAPKNGLGFDLESGMAVTGFSDDRYRYGGFRVHKEMSIPAAGAVRLGAVHRLLQSNDAVDINTTSVFAAKRWAPWNLLRHEVFVEPALEAGSLQANGRTAEWGAAVATGVESKDYRVSLQAAKTKFVTSFGVGIGARL